MSLRRLLLPLACLLIPASCSDFSLPLAARVQPTGPHFLRWAPTADLQFEVIGAAEVGAAFKRGGPLVSLVGGESGAASASTGLAPALDAYAVTFWAVEGRERTVQINYISGGVKAPFLSFTAREPDWVPGRGDLQSGDSVLITIRLDSLTVGAHFEPEGLKFDKASTLKIWYGGVSGDLNGDGLVNNYDTYIESNLLGMWYRGTSTSAWQQYNATKSLAEKSITTTVWHFSDYAVSW
ncbi:MAG: hypothetical protein OEW77_08465 [Gemmatimonadota bacterium]|nr:hypothetical protein [Gemmatimonadota bacterium]